MIIGRTSSRRCLLASLVILATAITLPRAAAEEPTISATEMARRVQDAHARDDKKTLRTLAQVHRPDPFLVADALRSADAGAEVQEAYAKEAAGSPAGQGLPALVGRWAALDAQAKGREANRRTCLGRFAERSPEQTLEHSQELERSLAIEPTDADTSLAGAQLLRLLGLALYQQKRIDDAEARFKVLLQRTESLRWPSGGRRCPSINSAARPI